MLKQKIIFFVCMIGFVTPVMAEENYKVYSVRELEKMADNFFAEASERKENATFNMLYNQDDSSEDRKDLLEKIEKAVEQNSQSVEDIYNVIQSVKNQK